MAKTFRNQVIGLIRFSYPARGGFARLFDTDAEARAFLYDRARMERRMALFERLCMPSLASQSDPDFTCVVLVGAGLPKEVTERLANNISKLSDARLVHLPPKPHYAAIKAAFASVDIGKATHRTTFRLDDDDALDCDFVARIKMRTAGASAFVGQAPLALAFNRGFYARQTESGTEVFDAIERTPVSVGTALLTPAGHPDNVFARNHRFLPQFFDCLSEAKTPAWIRTIHRDNDSDPFVQGRSKEMSQREIEKALKAGFATQLNDLQALFR